MIDQVLDCLQSRIKGEQQAQGIMTGFEDLDRYCGGLKPGDSVTIRYRVLLPTTPLPGPSQPPVLGEGETVPAFLKPGDGPALTVAAGGKSFEKL